MLNIIRTRLKQGYRTSEFPKVQPVMPELFLGLPKLDSTRCNCDSSRDNLVTTSNCTECINICPTNAISKTDNGLTLDLGLCIFCNACVEACPFKAIEFTRDYRLSVNKREDLLVTDATYRLAKEVEDKAKRIFGHSLKLREVSAGGCNACEADTNVLNTLVYDLGRFGIQFVASPRHADGIFITGPVTANMKLALLKTYNAISSPKLVIATGACALSGGIYSGHPETNNGVEDLLSVDLYIPGCPPHPYTILDGLLRLLGRI
jgi:Ni,Fe-hydrogenase III small subunit/NAD-dependent dihydropyrimidine dehydrogenase PreA subunit